MANGVMTLKIATWNINSVRLRIGLVERFLNEQAPDILCLQETKCPQGQFPAAPLHALGYHHIAEFGQKGYHGVAIVSRLPFIAQNTRPFCAKEDCRHISVTIEGKRPTTIHNFYVPAGGDEADPAINEKFDHKLKFIAEMEAWFADGAVPKGHESVVVGDLNIAPLEHDVWSHKDLLKVVSHTPIETAGLTRVQNAGGFIDVMRQIVPADQKLYTWWSYRAKDWDAANKGRRLDHIWATPDLAKTCNDMTILRAARGWTQPSDHVPVIASFKL
jgi:exodeoxyribonuclease III